jgi:hypothetical protein
MITVVVSCICATWEGGRGTILGPASPPSIEDVSLVEGERDATLSVTRHVAGTNSGMGMLKGCLSFQRKEPPGGGG